MRAVFIRAIEAQVDEKAATLRDAVHSNSSSRYDANLSSFSRVPGSPFAYWVSDNVRDTFARLPRLESGGRAARRTNGTTDDNRWIRAAWEVTPKRVGRNVGWVPHVKGGAYAPFYSDPHLLIAWDSEQESYPGYLGTVHRPDVRPASLQYFFRPGLTWPRRTNGLSFRTMPAGLIFGDKGPGVFVENDDPSDLLSLCAVVNSGPFKSLVAVQLARTELAQSFEAGLIQQTPVPEFGVKDATLLADLALRSWSLKRRLDTRTENSHAFLLPGLLQVKGNALVDRARLWGQVTAAVGSELDAIAAEIDDLAYHLYGIGTEDRERIEQGFEKGDNLEEEFEDGGAYEEDSEAAEVNAKPMTASLLSWSLGVAFGRFDVRLATGERIPPPEPKPFDPLPVCPPGMLSGDDGLPPPSPPAGYPQTFPEAGILVDDAGHPRDLVGAVRSVFDAIFDDANARWHEAAELLGVKDLRAWLARDFFEPHIKRYSKSRRKAPIYWQLATASGSYSVWIYIHRATPDTMFRVLNEFVGPKLDHERAKLHALAKDAGLDPSAAQRKELNEQEGFVGELQALKVEIERVAPLWRPNFDDGVILNFAPLWRLVPLSRSWQNECLKAWNKLVAGEYDWAHLAMQLWPERVVQKCLEDRSLAIAHGLEEVLWHEDEAGTWQQKDVSGGTIAKLIAERTSSTVKAALKDLLAAPIPSASNGRKPKARRASRRKTAPPVAEARQSKATVVDDATLEVVKEAIASVAEGASKAYVISTTGLSVADWNKAIAVLLQRGAVARTGKKRGTRYHATGQGARE